MTYASEYEVYQCGKDDWRVCYGGSVHQGMKTQREAIFHALKLQMETPGHISVYKNGREYAYRIIDERVVESEYLGGGS